MRIPVLVLHILSAITPTVHLKKYRSATITLPEEEDLVPQKCLEEYKKLQHQIEPIRVQKTLNVLQANMSFNSEAAHLQVPGYDGTESGRRRRRSVRHVRKKKVPRQSAREVTFYYGYVTPSVTTSSGTPEYFQNRVEKTEILYRVTKGLKELSICELETYYVRRYNKFPYFVKSVTCQKNRGVKGNIICKSRYEKGHILRLVNDSECIPDGNGGKWEHDWETRVVGCDAVLPVAAPNS